MSRSPGRKAYSAVIRRPSLGGLTLLLTGFGVFPVTASAQPQAPASNPNQTAIATPSTGNDNGPMTLQESLEKTRNARFPNYAGRVGVAVENEKAFEEMRRYILDMYDGEGPQFIRAGRQPRGLHNNRVTAQRQTPWYQPDRQA